MPRLTNVASSYATATRAWRWSSSHGASGRRSRVASRSIWCVPKGGSFPAIGAWYPPREFQLTHRGRRLSFSLADGDWFYFAGIWRPASHDWPEAYAVVTIEANGDVAPYQDRQMAVLRRRQRMDWLDLSRSEHELLQPLPIRAFRIERVIARQAQTALAL